MQSSPHGSVERPPFAFVIGRTASRPCRGDPIELLDTDTEQLTGCAKNKNAVSTMLFDGVTPIIAGHVEGTQRGSDPFNATGFGKVRFTLSQGLVSVEGPVTCLDVRGNTVGGVIRFDKASVPTLVGMEQYATFIDGGPGGANDRFAVSPSPVPAGTTKSCAPQPAIAVGAFLSGDVTIKDGKLGGAKK